MVCGSLPRCDSEPFGARTCPGLCGGIEAGGLGNARAYAFQEGSCPAPARAFAVARDVKYHQHKACPGPQGSQLGATACRMSL